MSRVTLNEHSVSFETNPVTINYMTALDRNWRFTDAAGHAHRYVSDPRNHFPTLREVEDGICSCGQPYCEDYMLTHLECRECGETVTPGMTGPGTETLPGLMTAYVDNIEVTPDEAMAFYDGRLSFADIVIAHSGEVTIGVRSGLSSVSEVQVNGMTLTAAEADLVLAALARTS